ncbi:MAG: hypothetical protein ACPGWR_28245 [Ardenticatenaceae bacterium]
MILDLPKSDELPSFAEMAKLLVKALPASDRSEAYTLLVTQLLPKKWARRPTFLPPRAQSETIFHELAEALQQAPPNRRIHLLRTDLCEIEIKQLSLDSLMLAVARYVKEHPDVTNLAQNWLGSRDLSKWLAMSASELEDETLRRWEQVDKWDELAKANHPEIWEEYKLKPFNVQLNLESALSGSFHAAMGELAIFRLFRNLLRAALFALRSRIGIRLRWTSVIPRKRGISLFVGQRFLVSLGMTN